MGMRLVLLKYSCRLHNVINFVTKNNTANYLAIIERLKQIVRDAGKKVHVPVTLEFHFIHIIHVIYMHMHMHM